MDRIDASAPSASPLIQRAKPISMTILVLVVAGNVLLATLFSLVALASD
ncbi:hypothetical protein [Methylobacterium sp. 77]|nr:hypothetical protein [Methylobacterium sp. 77]